VRDAQAPDDSMSATPARSAPKCQKKCFLQNEPRFSTIAARRKPNHFARLRVHWGFLRSKKTCRKSSKKPKKAVIFSEKRHEIDEIAGEFAAPRRCL
jgi:hypothetical protein